MNTSVVLYVNEAMNAGTLAGALHVAQNGQLVSGTTQVSDSGQVVVFTPSQPLPNGALVQVFVDETAQDTDGNSLTAYQGSFTLMAECAFSMNTLLDWLERGTGFGMVNPKIDSAVFSTAAILDLSCKWSSSIAGRQRMVPDGFLEAMTFSNRIVVGARVQENY